MSARFQRPGRILSPRERDRFRNELRQIDRQLQGGVVISQNKGHKKGGEALPQRRLERYREFMREDVREDPSLLRARKRRLETILRNGEPDSLSKAERAAKEKRAKELADALARQMAPRKMMQLKSGTPDFNRATEACLREFGPSFQKQASEYKNLMREIDPENPSAANLENIRPQS